MHSEEQMQANSKPLDEGVIVTGPVLDFPPRRSTFHGLFGPALLPIVLGGISGGYDMFPPRFTALPSNLPPPEPKTRYTKKPGILDKIKLCESSEAAHTVFHEFLDSADNVSQKTINRAKRLLETLDFPLP